MLNVADRGNDMRDQCSESTVLTLSALLGVVLVFGAVALAMPQVRESFSSIVNHPFVIPGRVCQLVLTRDDSEANHPEWLQLKAGIRGISFQAYSELHPQGRASVREFGIVTFPDLRVVNDGASVTAFKQYPWTLDDMKDWLMGHVPRLTWVGVVEDPNVVVAY